MDNRKAHVKSLVEAVLEHGDEKAFRELYRLYTPRLLGFVYRLLGRLSEDAEDVVQETWLRACKNLDSFRWDSVFSTWLQGIGLNIVREHIRRKYRMKETTMIEHFNAPIVTVNHDEQMDLENVISRLPDGYRMVLVLHDIEGWKHREIAQKLQVSEGTSKSQLFNARQMVRAMIATTKEHCHD